MTILEAIQARRSIKRFTDRPISRAEIEKLLSVVTLAPNHRLTEPWRFYVLGVEARRAYGLALGERRARKAPDEATASKLREAAVADHESLPCMIAVAVVESDNPEIREEDYAAAMMGVQNLALLAVELGLGTHLRTGAVMNDPAARAAIGVGDGERVVATIHVGEPVEAPPEKPRKPAALHTSWKS